MASNVNSMSFLLTAIIDGEDAVSLDVSPSSIVWNQEGDVSVDAQGNTVDNSSWPVQYITASVRKGDADESGWLYGFTIGSGCSFTVRKGTLSTDGKFTVDTNGHTFELSSPRKTKDASGKEAENLWTNGSLRITATKNGMKRTKDASIILNALATWKMSVINGTYTAVSSKVNAQVDGKIEKMQSEIKQSENEISLKVSSMTSGRNMWVNGDFSLPDTLAPAFSHIIDPNKSHVERIDGVDLPDGFLHRLVFNVPVANGGICYKSTQPHINTSTIAETGTNGLVTKNDYVLSLYAKATASCDMAIGLENVLTKTVSLTGQWQRFSVHIPKGTSLAKWTTAVIFYPTTAIGEKQYVCITGIQFETGSTPQTWSKSEFDMEVAGLRIGNGGIEAIAGKFDYIGKDGKPYIRVEQDENGYPHFVFYIPGTEYPAYDLGSTGLSQIVESSSKLTFPLVKLFGEVEDMQSNEVSGNFYIGKIKWGSDTNYSEVDVWNLSYEYYQTCFLGVYEFHPACFKNKAGTTIYVPTEAKNYENHLYWSQNVSDGLPIGTPVGDGWYLLVYAANSREKRRAVSYLHDGTALVNMGDETYNEVCYLAIGISGGKIISDRICFSVQTGPLSGGLRVWPIKDTANNIGLSFVFLDDSEDSSMISYDSANGVLKFYQPVIK